MLSHVTHQTGHGWGFGLHEALDQIGAILGPRLVSAVLSAHGSYQAGFGLLLIPALLALAVLSAARLIYPRPQDLEAGAPALKAQGFPRAFWLYLGAVALVAAGYADFPLMAYHFEKTALVAPAWIPVFYAVAMGVDALAALIFGRLFDRIGLLSLVIVSPARSDRRPPRPANPAGLLGVDAGRTPPYNPHTQ